jgi:cardiolipin synthase A/B
VSTVADPWWLAALAAIGLLALLTAFVTLFFALGRRPRRLFASHIPSVDEEDDFLLALAGAVNAPTRGGGTIRILRNGDEFFPSLLADIRAAERSVNFFTYIFESGEIADAVLAALTERAESGVPVRLMLDGFGGMTLRGERLDRLIAAGGIVHRYRPFHLGKLTRFHKRNHRRAIVIDGRVGYTGGAAISDKWLGNADSPEHWRDTMFRVTGPPAISLQATFGESWSHVSGEVLVGREFYPFEEPGARQIEPDSDRDGLTIARHVNLISSPSAETHPLRTLFWASFMAARQRLYLTNSYFVPDSHIRRALQDRARAGVDVRVLVPNELTDAKPIRWASQSYYRELLAAGVRIFEYQPTFLHAKTLVVDGRWSVIGSANMDIRSKELNGENVLGVMDVGFATELEDHFHQDLSVSREIRLEEWRRRPLGQRLLERFFVLFAEQY